MMKTEDFRIEIKWAVIYTIMTLGWAFVGKLLGLHDQRIQYNLYFNTAILIPSFLVYLLAVREKKRARYAGTITYRQGVASGLLLTLLVTILGPLNPWISTTFIAPDLFSNSIRYVVANGMMSESEAQSQFNLTAFIVQGLIGAPAFGLVLSLITAGFLRSRSTTVRAAAASGHQRSQIIQDAAYRTELKP